jgi:hypothetical protein
MFTESGSPRFEAKRFETFNRERFRLPPELCVTQPDRHILVRRKKIASTGAIFIFHCFFAIV